MYLFLYFLKVRSHQMQMKCYAQIIYMLSQCKDAIDNPAALFGANEAVQIAWITPRDLTVSHAIHANCASWKIWTLADIRANQSGACSSSDVIMSGGNNGGQLIVVVCGYPELYDYFVLLQKQE